MTFWQKTTEYTKKYQAHISTGALVVGFIIDNLTLNRIDQVYDNAVIIFYLLLAGLCILAFNYVEIRNLTAGRAQKILIFAPIIIQYAFGGLFSAFFVFYSRSGSFSASWPFIVLIITLLILNEFLKEKYSRLIYQVGIYFFAIFSYMIFLVPVILKEMGQLIFIFSGLISLTLIYIFTIFIHILTQKKYFNFNKKMWAVIFSTYLIMNIFYFTNILPPLPLSMKDSGAYNLVEKEKGEYLVYRKPTAWFNQFFNNKIEINPTSGLYYFSSVFAPTKLSTQIIHEWQFYDPDTKRWVETTKVPFAIIGGRDGGYRGYSLKQNLREGLWKVFTKTSAGQIIGEEKFQVIFTQENLNLVKQAK
jgi:hypothetical protein